MGSVRTGAGAAVVMGLLAGSLTGCFGPFAKAEEEGDGPPASGAKQGANAVSVADPTKVVVKATFDSPQAPGAKLQVGVVSLKVSGKLADLTLVLTPNVPGLQQTTVYRLLGGQGPDVSLIDTVNLKRHAVVRDSAGRDMQPSYGGQSLTNGQPTLQNYTFAAPAENVQTVDVHFGPFAPFRGVPVER
ncbi:MAG: hypothetical protein ACRDOO_16200 [Actinomadura sp.]